MRSLIFILMIAVISGGCNRSSKSIAKREQDSVKAILVKHQFLVKSITKANSILDSINHYRKSSPAELSTTEISERLNELSNYVKNTEEKITSMEHQLKITRNEANAYLMMVDALRGEVEIREAELKAAMDSTSRSQIIAPAETMARQD